MPSYHLITFGCQMNENDSERIATVLEKLGYERAPKWQGADLVVVNMCSVRQKAVDRVYGLLRNFKKLKEESPQTRFVLSGCILKKDKDYFKEIFDEVLDIRDLPRWPKILGLADTDLEGSSHLDIVPVHFTKYSAFVTISTGCNHWCAFCVVPHTRGPLLCRDHESILREVEELADQGYKEIWLLGQNVNDYRSPLDREFDFARLLAEIDKIKGDFWLRFTAANPQDFTDRAIEVLADHSKFAPYLNLPVQSGDDRVLKMMKRGYTITEYKKVAYKLKESIPDLVLSTDIIVGFPGETQEAFENTVRLVKEIGFESAFIAEYSPRPHTAAYFLKDNISRDEKKRRREVLTRIVSEIALEKNRALIGKELNVLFSEKRKQWWLGKTQGFKTVRVRSNEKLGGKIKKVRIKKALDWGLEGEIV